MAPKRAPSMRKRQRKMMTIAEKVELLDMLQEGRTYAAVARQYGLNESTVRYIKKDEANIRTASISFPKSVKRMSTARNKTMVHMESVLAEWITDCRNKNITLTSNIIQSKAKSLYEVLAANEPEEDIGDLEEEGEDPQPGTSSDSHCKKREFCASKGWFSKFLKRYGLKNTSWRGEAASEDTITAETYLNLVFKNIIYEGGYQPEQVFNMDETSLFWKRMPSRTFLFKEEAKASGFKAYKDRVTLMMCVNAVGFLLKPGFIYKSKNPKALKNKNKNLLPVHWMYNAKALTTKMLISDWFHQCFIPEVKAYLAEKDMPFKVLLLMDNTGGHATDLSYPGVKIEFLPPDIMSIVQPLDQGVIRVLKTLYMRNALANLVSSIDAAQEDNTSNLKTYWQQYTIATCLENIQKALQEMEPATVSTSWKTLWPEVVYDEDREFTLAEIQHLAVQEAVQLAAIIGGEGFSDMTEDDIIELLDCHSQPLTDQDLEELMKSESEEVEELSETEVASPNGLISEQLAEMCRLAKDLQQRSKEWDEDMVRSVQFCNKIDEAMTAYKLLLNEKNHQCQQLPITMFFK